jgi:hypothetical protein
MMSYNCSGCIFTCLLFICLKEKVRIVDTAKPSSSGSEKELMFALHLGLRKQRGFGIAGGIQLREAAIDSARAEPSTGLWTMKFREGLAEIPATQMLEVVRRLDRIEVDEGGLLG